MPLPRFRRPQRLPVATLPRTVALALTLALSGCTTFPDLDDRMTRAEQDADYPALLPADALLAEARATSITPETQTTLEHRVDALQARAARLRGSPVDAASRARMQAGVQTETP